MLIRIQDRLLSRRKYLYSEHTMNSQNSTIENNPIKKDLRRHFTTKYIWQQINTWKMLKIQIKTKMRDYNTPIRMSKLKNTDTKYWCGCHTLLLRIQNSTVTQEISLTISYKVKCTPTILTPNIQPSELKNIFSHKNLYIYL